MKHLEKAFAGTGCVHERGGEVDTGAGDTQLASRSRHEIEHATPGVREAEDRVGRELGRLVQLHGRKTDQGRM